jgi:hypothetical protein
MKTQSRMAKMPRVELFRVAIFEILTTDKPCRVCTVRVQQCNAPLCKGSETELSKDSVHVA